MGNLVKQVDHILIHSDNPHKAFAFLTDDLNLPKAWPVTSYGGFFKSGGVSLGDVNIEIISFNKYFKRLGLAPKEQGYLGIAFEPGYSLEETLPQLRERQIKYSRPRKFSSKGEHLWTNVNIKGLLPKSWIFFCHYEIDMNQEREKNRRVLSKNEGGTMGIQSLKEISIHYRDGQIPGRWKMLLGESQRTDEGYQFVLNDGVRIKMIRSNSDAINYITLKVNQLDRAISFLQRNAVHYKSNENSILMLSQDLGGTAIQLME